MLTGINRDRLLGHIVALFKHSAVNHREAVLYKIAVLVGNIKEKLVAAYCLLLLHHALRNNITGSKLLSLRLVLLHKPLLIAVKQIGALSSYCLGNQEALPVLAVCKGGGVELDIA